jgi:hypothetical protein
METLLTAVGIACFPVGAALIFQGWGIIQLGFLSGFRHFNMWGAVFLLAGIAILLVKTVIRTDSRRESPADSQKGDGLR